jgi:hypothetical protein
MSAGTRREKRGKLTREQEGRRIEMGNYLLLIKPSQPAVM